MKTVNHVYIRKRFVIKDYITAREKMIQRNCFNPRGLLKITFIGKSAVDDGRPHCEFFSRRAA